MTAKWIILFSLWVYPIISLVLLQLTKDKRWIRKRIWRISFLLSVIAILGLITHISTTISEIDWLMASSIYFTISLILWSTQFQYSRFVKAAGIFGMAFIFGTGYFSGTAGASEVSFTIQEMETTTEQWLDEGIIYKEVALRNVHSDYRGTRVEIYRTIPFFPFIEWRTQKKEYFNLSLSGNPLIVDYRLPENKLYLSAIKLQKLDMQKAWADTLTLAKW